MRTIDDIHFLQNKIDELRSALFFPLNDSVLKFPTTIVNVLNVDDMGQVWFVASRPAQYIQEFDKEFPAQLTFYRKGKSHFIKINGKARIINDPEELYSMIDIPDQYIHRALDNLVLVKVTINKAEYFEKKYTNTESWFKQMYNYIMDLLTPDHKFRPLIYQPADTRVSY